MTQSQSVLVLCGVCCVYPLIAAVIGWFVHARYTAGGWRGVIFGTKL